MGFGAKLLSNLIYRVLNVFALLFVTILLSRLMGVEGYGVLSLLIINVSVFNLFSSFAADAGITYHVAAGTFHEKKIITWIANIVLLQVISLGAYEFIVHFSNKNISVAAMLNPGYLWLAFFYLVSISLTEKYGALLNGKHLYVQANKALLLINIIFLLALLLLFVLRIKYNFFLYCCIFIGLQFSQAIILMFIYHTNSPASFALTFFNRKELDSFFSYSLIAFFSNAIQFLAYRMDFWFVAFFRTEKEVGWYSLAVRLVQFFWILSLSYATIIVPGVSADKENYSPEKLNSLIRFMNLANLVLGVLLFIFAEWIIPFLFGPAYYNSVLMFQILMPGVLLFCITNVLAAYFAGMNRLKINLTGSAICFLTILVLDLLLIPSYGMTGAAIASTVGYSVTTFYFIAVYCRHNQIAYVSLFFFKKSDLQQAFQLLKTL